MTFTFTLNGQPTTVDVPRDMPLLWVLRDELDLKGTKFGCGRGECAACTVHVNGAATRTCRLPVHRVDGAEITTIEGLSEAGDHPVQVAWQEVDVPQCGYCQAGQIMAASALLEENPSPSDDEITSAMNRNLCRCGTYLRIREAIQRSAEIMSTQAGVSGSSGASNG